MAYETPLTVAEVIQDIAKNKYVLPSIQREYKWDTERIEKLFDSLMQGYPIGTFLFWFIEKDGLGEYDFYEFLKKYHEKNTIHNVKVNLSGSDGIIAVLDGQQRLTSLYIGLKGTYAYRLKYKKVNGSDSYPERKLFLNLISQSIEEDCQYQFSFLTPDEVINDLHHYWFEVGEILNMNDMGDISEYIMENISYSEIENYTKEQSKFANNTLAQLYRVIHDIGTISYYKEKSRELDKVLNIFIRVNSGGMVLSYSDLLLSIASAQWENHDAREEITAFVDDINSIGTGFSANKDFVLKTALVLSDFSDIAFKVDNFNKSNMMLIESNWEKIKLSIFRTLKLISTFGFSKDTLSSYNAVIPIAYYFMHKDIPDNFIDSDKSKNNRQKIKKWLIQSLLKRAFSGQPDNVLRPIREIIKSSQDDEFPYNAIVERFKGTNKSIIFNEDDIDEYLMKIRYGKTETLSTLMLLYPHLDYKNIFHIDHIFPKSKFNKSYLKQVGISENLIDEYIYLVNDIGNLQLLAATPNEEKSNTDFNIWFYEHNTTESEKIQYRKTNYIPDMEYSYDKFIDFIESRRGIIKKELRSILL